MVDGNSENNVFNGSRLFLVFVFVIVSTPALHAQQKKGSLEGTVIDKNTRQPLELVNVLIEGTTIGAASDSEGRYDIHNIPVGVYTVRFSIIGFKKRRFSNTQVRSGKNVLDAVLEDSSLQVPEVLVTPKSERYDASGISARLAKDMVASAPGSAQDIFWVVQTLPGITSDGDNSKLYVRGGSPDENLVLFDGATIGNPFHFDFMGGGFWSIFNSRLVDKVEFYGGGFPARYGDRISSVLVIENRTADFEKSKGEVSVSMSDAGGILETPLSFANGSALFAVRRSYLDLLLKYTDLAGQYDVLPYFFDINSKLDFNISQDHKLTISGLFSNERMYAYFDESPHYTGTFSWKSINAVATARLRSILSDFFLSDFILSWSAVDRSSRQPGDGIEDATDKGLSIKQDFATILPSLELHFGAWLAWEQQQVEINLPKETAINFDEMKLRGDGASFKPSLYVDGKWNISSSLLATMGVRYDYVAKSKENALAPRLNIAYAWNDHMSLSADYGWYYQSPKAYELAVNNNLRSKKAESYGLGIKHHISDEIVVSLEVYNKNLSQLITIDSLWNLSNDGIGYSRGAEFYIQLRSPSGFSGWLSYTYSVSKRKEGTNADLHYFDFDRPHLLSLVANYHFAEHWQAGARFRYGTGKPYTPVASAFYNPTVGHWFPIPSEHNSARFEDYSRLDVRITRHFQLEKFDMDVYLELLNSYNRKNPIHYMWNETYSDKDPVTAFPFLPVLGVSARF
ncbi:MAG: hypothetical protein HW389_1812 [Bacteroidetes bacterium]|nr:hypothetical protein [Bacteroidota bacterium]